MILVNVVLALLNCSLALPSCLDPMGRCLNGGVCVEQFINKVNSTACLCSAGYYGEKCEKLDICEVYSHYCNAGTCLNINGSAVCHCSVGYSGRNCEYTLDKCGLGNICRNGGNCIDDICFCTDGFSGEVCERHVPERDDYLRAGCEEHPEFCALRFADGICHMECNTKKCFFDGFDCVMGTQKCRLSDYCALHYLDGKCDENCAVPECGYDGMDCSRNTRLHELTEISTVGIILDASSANILEKIYSILAELAQKLHNPVHLVLDNNNKTRIYEWSDENGVGQVINLEKLELSRNATGVLLYVDFDSTFCEKRLHINATNVLPCFTDVFSAVAYLHTALYDEANDRISLGDITVKELFVENDRSHSFSAFAIFIPCFIFVGLTLCFCGIYGFFDERRKRNVERSCAPVWKVPPAVQSWSTVSTTGDYLPDKDTDTCRRDGLPPSCRVFSSSVSCGQEYAKDSTNHHQVEEISEQKIRISLDAYFSDNGVEDYHLGPDLLRAIKCNDFEAVSFLVLRGADVNCSDSDDNTALHHAVAVNSDQIIRLLLSTHRCNLRAVNVLGQTPLTLTVKFAHVSDICARCILDFMYSENCRKTAAFPQSCISRSAFTTASSVQQFCSSFKREESDGCVFTRDILSEEDDPTLTDIFGRTAIHYAALNRRVDLLPELYAFGLRLDTKDNKGETPLYLAAREGHLDMVNLLMSLGANSAISDQLGRTPLDMARERGHYLVVEFLGSAAGNNVCMIKTVKRKRIRKQSSTARRKLLAKCKSKKGSQKTILLNSSSIASRPNEDKIEDIFDIDEDMAISSSFLNSIKSFVLTPSTEILAEGEKEHELNAVDSAIPDYTDLTANSCLPSDVSPVMFFP